MHAFITLEYVDKGNCRIHALGEILPNRAISADGPISYEPHCLGSKILTQTP